MAGNRRKNHGAMGPRPRKAHLSGVGHALHPNPDPSGGC
jgi:hypothetical protein